MPELAHDPDPAGRPLLRRVVSGPVTTLVMDSPGNRNALSTAMIDQLVAGVAAAVAAPGTRVIVLSHAGPAFCSGADLAATPAGTRPDELPMARLGGLIATLWECPVPVVARVAGPARGGGLGLIAAADLAVCAAPATFAFSEVRVGVIPAVISAVVLPRLAPRAAGELYLTGEPFDGVRAARIGLVTAAVPADQLDRAVDRYVSALLRGAPGALAGAKALLRRRQAVGLREDLRELTELSLAYATSPEGVEGALAFREKRDPAWRSRG